MNIAVLDVNTVTVGDLDFSCFDQLGNTAYYDMLPVEEVIEKCAEADAVLINKTMMSREVISKLPNLKYIGLFATGYNNVDLEAASERGIAVVNIPGYSTDAVAQHVFAFILMHASNINKYDQAVHRGEWICTKSFSFFPYPIQELAGKTLGIVGYGNIGKKVAQIGRAFGMKILVCSRRKLIGNANCRDTANMDPCRMKTPDIPQQVNKKELFSKSDYISLHCPLNEGTADYVDKEALSWMKESAFLINTSRGGVVDSAALAEALNNDRIAGAGIDVLRSEPMEKDEPLYKAKNCILTPHVAWAALESRRRCVRIAAENLSSWINGKPQNVVNN